MCTWAVVAVAVKSKIERDLIAMSSLLLEARFFCSERLSGCSGGCVGCAERLCELRAAPNTNGQMALHFLCAACLPLDERMKRVCGSELDWQL